MLDVKTFTATIDGHDIKLEFDNKLVVTNRLRLYVDGELVDSDRVVYGTKELRAPVDGGEVELRVHSGMAGEPDRPQLRGSDGTWVDMVGGA